MPSASIIYLGTSLVPLAFPRIKVRGILANRLPPRLLAINGLLTIIFVNLLLLRYFGSHAVCYVLFTL